MKKTINIFLLLTLSGAVSFSCMDVLDKQNLTAVNPSEVWGDASIATAYLDNIYANLMPGNPQTNTPTTDEAVAYQRQANAWMNGTATFDSWDNFGQYTNIRTINILLDNIDGATFDEQSKSFIKGQALFWRAWSYYGMVKGYGGIPLVLTSAADLDDLSSLEQPRNKTSECVTQILKDLDDAISLLPDAWEGNNIGRIDKGAAMAFKGRVLLFFASPLFEGAGGVATWQNAYDANKAAKEFLEARGNGLYAPYSQIWEDELNLEVIMVKRFNYPEATYFQGALMPLNWSKDNVGNDRPSLELVDAFPMKDGSQWDPAAMSYDTLFRNRDDRFYASIYYNGSPNQYLAGMRADNTYLWTYFNEITDYYGNTGLEGAHNQITTDPLWSNSSFYRVKAIDKTIDIGGVYNAAVDWPEIRFAEVLMNFGESANEIGRSDEALEVLYQIRDRAGIQAGNNQRYGITANSQSEIRDAYKKERFVEFCFEGKRWDDLRRWKMFDHLRALPQRHGIAVELKPGESDVQPLDDIEQIWTKFKTTVIPTDQADIAISDQFYFYGIPRTRLDRNSKLEQNNNWGGTFDPLQ